MKTTRFPHNNVFEFSQREWEFATGLPRVRYCVFRVFSAGDVSRVKGVIVPDVARAVEEQIVKLCLAV